MTGQPNCIPTIEEIQHFIHQCACEHGWWDSSDLNNPDVVGAKIALVHSELSEALEAVRNHYPKDELCSEFGSLEIELADAIIRILDLAAALGLDMEQAILAKMAYNETRPRRHGGKAL